MSTASQQQLGFASATVDKLPTIACVGYVDEVGEGKVSKSEVYINQPIKIRGNGANRSVTKYLLYRPEWLVPGFNPDTIKESGDGARGMLFVYQSNIIPGRGAKKISALQGLCGSEERFNELANRLLTASYPETGDNATPEETAAATSALIAQVRSILHQFLVVEGGEAVPVGYQMIQEKEDTGDVDEKGKKVKVATERYTLGDFFYPTEQKLKNLRSFAQHQPGKMRVAFDEVTPF